MAKKKKQDETLTSDDIAEMPVEDVLDELLFQSHFVTTNGPLCKCMTSRLTHFMGTIPHKICGKILEEVDLAEVPDFETEVSSLCVCQRSHFFKLKLEDENLEYEETQGQNMDNRRLRLPNF